LALRGLLLKGVREEERGEREEEGRRTAGEGKGRGRKRKGTQKPLISPN